MDPEQWLFVIHKYLAVEINVLFLCTFARALAPQRMDIIDGDRTFHDLNFLFRLCLFAVLFRSFFDMLHHLVCVEELLLIDGLVLRLCICL